MSKASQISASNYSSTVLEAVDMEVDDLILKLKEDPSNEQIAAAIEKVIKIGGAKDYVFYNALLRLFFGCSGEELNKKMEKIKSIKLQQPVCGKIFIKNEIFYECFDCRKNGSAAYFCRNCFVEEKHLNHNYQFCIGERGGICDCGDDEVLDPKSFCPKHFIPESSPKTEEVLPEYIRLLGRKFVEELANRLHLFLCETDAQQFSKRQKLQTGIILWVLGVLYKNLGMFHSWIGDALCETYDNHITSHRCCSGEIKDTKKPHICTCSVVENLMKQLSAFLDDERISEFLGELAKRNTKYAKAFIQAFFSNYDFIYKMNRQRRRNFERFNQIMYNTTFRKESLIKGTLMPSHLELFCQCLKNTIFQFSIDPSNADVENMLAHLYYDFTNFFAKEKEQRQFILKKTSFIGEYIFSIQDLQYLNPQERRTTNITRMDEGVHSEIYTNTFFLFGIFAHLISGYDMEDIELNQVIMRTFKNALQEDFKKKFPKYSESYISLYIPLYRLFGLFLNKILYNHPLLKDETKVENFIEKTRQILKNHLDITKDDELNEFIKMILKVLFTVLGYLCEILGNKWSQYGNDLRIALDYFYSINCKPFLGVCDLMIIQRLLPLVANLNLLESDIFPETFQARFTNHQAINEEEEKSELQNDYTFFYLASLLGNETNSAVCYFYFSMDIDILDEIMNMPDFQYIMKKESISYLFTTNENSMDFFPLKMLVDESHIYLQNPAIESAISDCYTLYTRHNNQEKGSKINQTGLNHFDIFYYFNPENWKMAKENLFNLRTQLDFSKYDFLKGGKKNKKLMLVNQGILGAYLESGLLERIVEILNNSFKELTIWQKLSSMKILYEAIRSWDELSLLQYEKITQLLQKCNKLIPLLQTLKKEEVIFDNSINKVIRIISSMKESEGSGKDQVASVISKKKLLEKKKRQRELLRSKRKKFLEDKKIQEDLERKSVLDYSKCCTICEQELKEENFFSNPFGTPCFFAGSNVKIISLFQTMSDLQTKYPLPTHFSNFPRNIALCHLLNLSTCPNKVHYSCLKRSYGKFESNKNHFCCPSCQRLSNCLLPSPSKRLPTKKELKYIEAAPFKQMFDSMMTQGIIPIFEKFNEEIYEKIPDEITLDSAIENIPSIISIFMSVELESFLGMKGMEKEIIALQSLFESLILYIILMSKPNKVKCLEMAKSLLYSPEKLTEALTTKDATSIICFNLIGAYITAVLQYYMDETADPSNSPATIICEKWKEMIQPSIQFYLTSSLFHQGLKLIFMKNNNSLSLKNFLDPSFKLAITQTISNNLDLITRKTLEVNLRKVICLYCIIQQWDLKVTQFIQAIQDQNNFPNEFKEYMRILGFTEDMFNSLLTLFGKSDYLDKALKLFLRVNYSIRIPSVRDPQLHSSLLQQEIQLTPPYLATISKPVFRLIDLPETYDKLMLEYFPLNCENCNLNVKSKCVCLICGRICCAHAKCCFRSERTTGEVCAHALECGMGKGYFIYLLKGMLVTVTDGIGMCSSAFYVSDEGESIRSYFRNKKLPYKSNEMKKFKISQSKYQELKESFIKGTKKINIEHERKIDPSILVFDEPIY